VGGCLGYELVKSEAEKRVERSTRESGGVGIRWGGTWRGKHEPGGSLTKSCRHNPNTTPNHTKKKSGESLKRT